MHPDAVMPGVGAAPQEDFKPWNPIIPAHYIKVCRKAYGAMARNNWKVGAWLLACW